MMHLPWSRSLDQFRDGLWGYPPAKKLLKKPPLSHNTWAAFQKQLLGMQKAELFMAEKLVLPSKLKFKRVQLPAKCSSWLEQPGHFWSNREKIIIYCLAWAQLPCKNNAELAKGSYLCFRWIAREHSGGMGTLTDSFKDTSKNWLSFNLELKSYDIRIVSTLCSHCLARLPASAWLRVWNCCLWCCNDDFQNSA